MAVEAVLSLIDIIHMMILGEGIEELVWIGPGDIHGARKVIQAPASSPHLRAIVRREENLGI